MLGLVCEPEFTCATAALAAIQVAKIASTAIRANPFDTLRPMQADTQEKEAKFGGTDGLQPV